jgi:hypothetical protein
LSAEFLVPLGAKNKFTTVRLCSDSETDLLQNNQYKLETVEDSVKGWPLPRVKGRVGKEPWEEMNPT